MSQDEKHGGPTITVAMPAFNEARNVEDVVRGVLASFKETGLTHEVLIVDDGSTDGTADVADRLAAESSAVRVVHHERNRGLGAAWRTCIAASRGEWVFVQPADGQVPPSTARHYYESKGDADVVIGVREQWARPLHRRVLTWGFRLLTRVALGLSLPEFGACFLFRGPLVRSLRVTAGDVGVAVVSEWLFLARRQGAIMGELPVELLPRAAGTSKSGNPRDAGATLIDLLRAAVIHRVRGRRGT